MQNLETVTHGPNLALSGQCAYQINNDRVVVTIAEIDNNNSADLLSGTLAIELWALSQPYQGRDFQGHALAATTIGSIQGQCCLRDCRYDLSFQQPPAGQWSLCLMLREWDGNVYVTRDYSNFALPYRVAADVKAEQPAAKVVSLFSREGQNPDTASTPPVAKAATAVTAKKVEATPAAKASTPAQPEATTTKVAAQATPAAANGNAKPAAAQPARPQTGKQESSALSINSASVKDLASGCGLSKKVAEAVVAGRPYQSLQELLKVKGIGEKLLLKLRGKIRL